MTSGPHPYLDIIARRTPEPGKSWFFAQADRLTPSSLAASHAGVGRRLGAEPVAPSSEERQRLAERGLPAPEGWPLSAVGRAVLLVRACEQAEPRAQLELVVSQFKSGDNAERESVLRALQLLPAPERFVDLAIDACRSHVQTIFEAIACENPYPARFFPAPNFNQLVLKAFFTGVEVRRIVGLVERRSPELARMAFAYASERRAAGRSVPADLDFVTGASSL
jgi:hypothetical protein